MADDWGLMENWDESETLSTAIDEVTKAAIRVVDEAVTLTQPPVHDGTKMVLVPESLFTRLKEAIGRLREFGEY